jgi:hypothetical protein
VREELESSKSLTQIYRASSIRLLKVTFPFFKRNSKILVWRRDYYSSDKKEIKMASFQKKYRLGVLGGGQLGRMMIQAA